MKLYLVKTEKRTVKSFDDAVKAFEYMDKYPNKFYFIKVVEF